ncbi:hypothetical protein NUW54_g9141 [Trametes sanguinea]|uniref:Uncharacterized protein n=1 Tax=Trametes sanguinea TaxID=158606 RepID=A0ACC1P9Q0_9APHY|nr:hypothetical protein NUW54_g9141 [Trametes sanguinea]
MNVVQEIKKINQRELELGIKGSWHDDYKDSAYIFVGGLHRDLTEGDVITIFSQYGEIMDINMPRDKETGKQRGFAFLMYEDQRSTILAVDNLNGAKVLDRTLRVDHVKNYKQGKIKGEDGEWHEPDEQSFNAKPEIIMDAEEGSESSEESGPDIDPEDPMRDFLIAQWKEERAKGKKSKSKRKHKDETAEERRARKARKKGRKEKKSAGMADCLQATADVGAHRLGGHEAGPQCVNEMATAVAAAILPPGGGASLATVHLQGGPVAARRPDVLVAACHLDVLVAVHHPGTPAVGRHSGMLGTLHQATGHRVRSRTTTLGETCATKTPDVHGLHTMTTRLRDREEGTTDVNYALRTQPDSYYI